MRIKVEAKAIGREAEVDMEVKVAAAARATISHHLQARRLHLTSLRGGCTKQRQVCLTTTMRTLERQSGIPLQTFNLQEAKEVEAGAKEMEAGVKEVEMEAGAREAETEVGAKDVEMEAGAKDAEMVKVDAEPMVAVAEVAVVVMAA